MIFTFAWNLKKTTVFAFQNVIHAAQQRNQRGTINEQSQQSTVDHEIFKEQF